MSDIRLNTQIYFHCSDQAAIEAILGVKAAPYQEAVMMAEVSNQGSLTRLKQERYTKPLGYEIFGLAYLWYHEVGATREEHTGEFDPKLDFYHPVKGKTRFTTVPGSTLVALDKKSSVEKGRAEDRMLIDAERPIPSAFSVYQNECGSKYKMVVVKRPRTLRRELEILAVAAQEAE